MTQSKKELLQSVQGKDDEGVIDALLTVRVKALQVLPGERESYINNLISVDIFDLKGNNNIITDLLKTDNVQVKHAVTSVMSILSSTEKGIKYLVEDRENTLVPAVIKVIY